MTAKCYPAPSMLPVENSPLNPILNHVNQSPSLFVEPQYIASAPTPNDFSNQVSKLFYYKQIFIINPNFSPGFGRATADY